MIEYNLNDIKIFKSSYLYSTSILGYSVCEINKTIETIYYLTSHGKKFQISVEKYIDNKSIKDLNIKAKQVDIFEIPEKNNKEIKYSYFYFDEPLMENLNIKQLNELDDLIATRFIGKETKEKSKCIVGEYLFIAIEDNIYNIYEKITNKGNSAESAYDLAKKMLTFDELKQYVESKR